MKLFYPFSIPLLLALLFTASVGELPGQSNAQWQFHSGWARFFPDNEYHHQVVELNGNVTEVYEDFPILNSLAVGIGYQRPLRPKLALEASWYYTQANQDFTEWYWRFQSRRGRDLSDIKTTTTHALRMSWFNLQAFFQQHWQKGSVLELGMGLGGAWHDQHYRSGFIYNEFLEQMDSEEYTRKRTWAIHLPMTMRSTFPLSERWMVGIEASGQVFFNEAQLLVFLGASAHYQIGP